MTELQKVKRRVKAVRAVRRSTELEGSRSTNATRADQVDYARGTINAAELRDRVRRRYNMRWPSPKCRTLGTPPMSN